MATKKTSSKASVTTKRGTDRATHQWTPEQLAFLADRPDMKREDLGTAFRKAFPKFTGSTTAIVGKRYTLLHKGSSRHPGISKRSLEARAERLRAELAEVEARIAELAETAPVDLMEALKDASMVELRAAAKAAGVKASGTKAAIVERIAEVAV